MADKAGQALIRGIDIDKTNNDYFEEALIFKNECTVESTSSREVRYYQKTSGYLTMTSPAGIRPIAAGTRPFVVEQSWTRNTAYVKAYKLDSMMITMEDESDSEVPIFKGNAEDVAAAIAYSFDGDVYNVATENDTPVNINTNASTAAWDTASGQDPAEDVFEAEQKIREQTKRKLVNGKLYVSAKGNKDLKTWIVGNGANMTQAASELVKNGILTEFGGFPVVVSENVSADKALLADLKQSVKIKEFKPFTTYILEEKGVGRKVRCTYHAIAILVKPKYNCLITNTET